MYLAHVGSPVVSAISRSTKNAYLAKWPGGRMPTGSNLRVNGRFFCMAWELSASKMRNDRRIARGINSVQIIMHKIGDRLTPWMLSLC